MLGLRPGAPDALRFPSRTEASTGVSAVGWSVALRHSGTLDSTFQNDSESQLLSQSQGVVNPDQTGLSVCGGKGNRAPRPALNNRACWCRVNTG